MDRSESVISFPMKAANRKPKVKAPTGPVLNWWTKRKLYRLGYYLKHDFDGVRSQPFESARQRTHTDTSFIDWAIDFRSCGADAKLDDFYLQPDNSYRPVPTHLKPVDRSFWREVRSKSLLLSEGQRIMQLFYD